MYFFQHFSNLFGVALDRGRGGLYQFLWTFSVFPFCVPIFLPLLQKYSFVFIYHDHLGYRSNFIKNKYNLQATGSLTTSNREVRSQKSEDGSLPAAKDKGINDIESGRLLSSDFWLLTSMWFLSAFCLPSFQLLILIFLRDILLPRRLSFFRTIA